MIHHIHIITFLKLFRRLYIYVSVCIHSCRLNLNTSIQLSSSPSSRALDCLRGLNSHRLAGFRKRMKPKTRHVNPVIAECRKKSQNNLNSRSSGDCGVFFNILLISRLQNEENHGIPQNMKLFIYILRCQRSTPNDCNERYRYQPPPNEGNRDSSFFSDTG